MRQLNFVEAGRAEWREAPDAKLEGDAEAVVRPLAVAACDLDAAIMRGEVPFEGPFPLGHEFVGEVMDAGEAAGIEPGARVVVTFQISCGECERCRRGLTGNCTGVQRGSMYGVRPVGGDWGGAFSDLVRVPYARAMLVPLPGNVDPVALGSISDNVADAWRTVAPPLRERPAAEVLIVAGAAHSISLYAVQIAVALGAGRVDYLDTDAERLALAESLGAQPVEGPPPKRAGTYPITVNAGAGHAALHCAIRSTEPEGVCTSVSIPFEPETPVPLFEMYTRGIHFHTSRVNSRTVLPEVLALVEEGRIDPAAVTSQVVSFDELPDALADPPTKLIATP